MGFGSVAQMVERMGRPVSMKVAGSSPVGAANVVNIATIVLVGGARLRNSSLTSWAQTNMEKAMYGKPSRRKLRQCIRREKHERSLHSYNFNAACLF